MAKLTKTEMEFLSSLEPQMEAVHNAHYYRGIGREAAKKVNSIYERVTGKTHFLDTSCGGCIMEVLDPVAGWYFEQKASNERKAILAAATLATQAIKKASKSK